MNRSAGVKIPLECLQRDLKAKGVRSHRGFTAPNKKLEESRKTPPMKPDPLLKHQSRRERRVSAGAAELARFEASRSISLLCIHFCVRCSQATSTRAMPANPRSIASAEPNAVAERWKRGPRTPKLSCRRSASGLVQTRVIVRGPKKHVQRVALRGNETHGANRVACRS
jgi:hypothetical protein